jgi:hypothetical protein
MLTRGMACARIAAVPLALGALIACGGGSGSPTATPTPTPTPVPTPLPPVTVAQRTDFQLQANYIMWLPFPTSRAGLLEGTVDWTSVANDLNAYLVRGECNYDQLVAGQCETLVSSEGTTKPETLRYQSPQASTYTIFIHNRGPGDESVSFLVTLSASLATSASSDGTRRLH